MTLTVQCVAVGSLLCAVAAAACGGRAPEEVETETVVPVTAEPARTGSIRAVIHASGIVQPAPGADLLVIAPQPARIADLPKAEGESVQSGDLLVRFDIPSLGAEVLTKSAEVAGAEARIQNAKAAQARARELFDRGVAARKEMEDADRDLAEAEAALNQAIAGRSASQTLAERTTVRATFSGIVAKRWHNPGDLVEAAAGDPVLRVIDPDRLEVVASVPILDVARVRVGASAVLNGALDPTAGALRVVSRPAAVEPGTAAVPVRLAFVRPTALPAGAPVQMDIHAEEHVKVVLVPAEAIVREAEETAVFVVVGNKAKRRPVVTGLSDAQHVEVRSGLKVGELVITRGQAGLPDDAAIALDTAETSTSGSEKPADEKAVSEK